jgi:hypothetical protein
MTMRSPLLVLTQSIPPNDPKKQRLHKHSNGANNSIKLNTATKNYPPVNFLLPIATQHGTN